jgi:hypothetical protein
LGQKIKHVLLTTSCETLQDNGIGPGGRHDNDFVHFREIAILPTADELSSSEQPFYRRADTVDQADPDQRVAMHLDNQFRLQREDMLGELRTDLQIAKGMKKGKRTGLIIGGLFLEGIDCGSDRRRKSCGLTLRCNADFPQLSNLDRSQRKSFITENRGFLKHQSFGCLMDGSDFIAFATIDRNEDLLANVPPVIVLQISGEASLKKALLALNPPKTLQFLQVDTPIFAHEHVLKRLQEKTALPLAEELIVNPAQGQTESPPQPCSIIQEIKNRRGRNLKSLLRTPMSIVLDESQFDSLIAGLTRRVSLIHGPPGTTISPLMLINSRD